MEPTTIFIIAQTIWDFGLMVTALYLLAHVIAITCMVFAPDEELSQKDYFAVRLARTIRGYLKTDKNCP